MRLGTPRGQRFITLIEIILWGAILATATVALFMLVTPACANAIFC